jgi:uncharacterized membrane protein
MKRFCTSRADFSPTALTPIFHLPRIFLLPLLMSMLAISLPGAARADLRVCNQSAGTVSIALGYRSERGWQSEGWWVTGPNDCKTVYSGDLTGQFYYIYAVDDVIGSSWDGQIFMCTRDDDAFTIFGVEDCLARGYERTGFFEIDTQEKTDWTLQLTETPANETPQSAAPADEAPAQ